ncbi:hypothetical protein QBC46DRAFT_48419 [Diplogelasinospora grovesii]|uniref:Zn(2)-C6 fungal-type domain-containing protein n=1 Tax=Diplogelasinospora grovesii TaxID=303347 RepID=A0AAN6NC97_9PEZI|nr:hypothetical protein QBC46DRAFT_48419 [Diplogelasinospora grovesii]
MIMDSLPSPPNDDPVKSNSSKKQPASSKSAKTGHRVSKRPSSNGYPQSPPHEAHPHSAVDGRHNKRVWKACERCRMKKTKCDGEFPCKRCKDDGLVCTAGSRKKTEYKQLPRGYAEVLENTQFALIATVHKLYSMVRNQQQWALGDPELNDRGQPVIHDIASKLGCIRPNSDVDLPVHSVFPEDEAGLAELAKQLEAQERNSTSPVETSKPDGAASCGSTCESDSVCNTTDRVSSPELTELGYSDFEHDRFRSVLNEGGSVVTMSPQSATPSIPYNEFKFDKRAPATTSLTPSGTACHSAAKQFLPIMIPATIDSSWPYPDYSQYAISDFSSQPGWLNSFEADLGTIKPHMLTGPGLDPMIDSMAYSPVGSYPL